MKRRKSDSVPVWPLAILALTAIVLLVGSLVLGARQVDRQVRSHEEFLVRQGIDGQVEQMRRALVAQTVRDDAVLNLDNRLDERWADRNIAANLHQSIGVWDYVIVDGDDRAVWGRQDTSPMPVADRLTLRRMAQPVIDEIRAIERQRPNSTEAASTVNEKLAKGAAISRSEIRDGRGYMWIASLVRPDLGTVTPSKARSTIVIGGGFITDPNIAALQQRYQLKHFRLEPDASKIRRGEARTVFRTFPGAAPVSLVWTPETPGSDLLGRSIWVVGGVVVFMAALVGLMTHSTRRAARSLSETHRAQAEFLANMSHEIRTPLNGVNALSEALTKTPLSKGQREMADTIHRSGLMLSRLLSDILDLARIDARGLSLEPEPFQLSDAVNAAVDIMRPKAEEKGLALGLDLDPAAETWVLGDVTRLGQILSNLLSNAIKFTGRGHVRLSVRPAPEVGESVWRFEVQDTGIGFDPSQTERIFKRFQQADGSVTRRFGGTGLGLAIARELAGIMGGRLEGQGSPGAGAVFTLDLPLPVAEVVLPDPLVADGEADIANPDQEPATRVLVSEDHPINRMVIETLLGELGMNFLSTENGLEACEAFEIQDFDLILMDMQMPVMDGLTAIRRIRQHEEDQNRPPTPIIMITANALPEHRAAGIEAGADLFITKPLSAETFFGALSALRATG